jgi:hypothetical protein
MGELLYYFSSDSSIRPGTICYNKRMENHTVFKIKLRENRILVPLVALMFAIILLIPRSTDEELNMPRNYIYGKVIASNRMELHYLRTRPSNVMLQSVNHNVTEMPFYGINGGFFYQDDLLSIAVVNDKPVNEAVGEYGAGAANAKYARGTLVWDGNTDRLSVQVVSLASELVVTDRLHYWAQGGISMSLRSDEHWLEQMETENAPLPIDDCLRSAAVFDNEGNIYLVVSTTKGSLASFREAILEQIGVGHLEDGIFLDGDGSSQLRSREAKLRGDGRAVVQMLRLIN